MKADKKLPEEGLRIFSLYKQVEMDDELAGIEGQSSAKIKSLFEELKQMQHTLPSVPSAILLLSQKRG